MRGEREGDRSVVVAVRVVVDAVGAGSSFEQVKVGEFIEEGGVIGEREEMVSKELVES